MKAFICSKKGQTAVEYLLMLIVVVTLIYTFMGKVKEYFFAERGSCTESSTSFICQFEKMYNNQNFRWFVIKR